MLKLTEVTQVGKSMLTLRRMLLASAAAAGLYTVGDDGLSYVSTAFRLATEEVGDNIPIEFELERAKTMIVSLVPDIKRNMILIAKEEVGVETIREDAKTAQDALEKQREQLVKLRDDAQNGKNEIRFGSRPATEEEIREELKRRLAHFKLSDATLGAKQDLLANRENSLKAARAKLEKMFNAKRDLQVQVENLQARLRSVQSGAVAKSVDFDDTQVAKCQKLLDDLRVRLQVTERLISADGDFEDIATTITVSDKDVIAQIDEYLGKKSPGEVASSTRVVNGN